MGEIIGPKIFVPILQSRSAPRLKPGRIRYALRSSWSPAGPAVKCGWDKEIPLCWGPNLLTDWVAWSSRCWTDRAKARLFAEYLGDVAKEVLRNEPDQDDEEYWEEY